VPTGSRNLQARAGRAECNRLFGFYLDKFILKRLLSICDNINIFIMYNNEVKQMKPSQKNEILQLLSKFIEEIDKRHKVSFAYLFGSYARGQQRKDSDVDIALMFSCSMTDLEDAFFRGELMDIGRALLQRDVDIVSLDRASTFLKYQIVKDGIVIREGDERASFESLVFREYFDFKYYSDIYDEAMLSRIKSEGQVSK
jgi:uncharacterized protein